MNVCFFCAASENIGSKYFTVAKEFGEQILKKEWTLVTGGSNVGLMKALSNYFNENNGKSIGIIPKVFADRNLTYPNSSETIVTKNLFERKKILIEKSDAFITLPGGFGTLDELLEVITLKQIGLINKPIVVFNQDGFYTSLLRQFETIFEHNFARINKKHAYFVTTRVNDTLNYIENYKPNY